MSGQLQECRAGGREFQMLGDVTDHVTISTSTVFKHMIRNRQQVTEKLLVRPSSEFLGLFHMVAQKRDGLLFSVML